MRAPGFKYFTLIVLAPLYARASVGVEQLEALETPNTNAYAPINFGGVATVTETSGGYNGITFHAIDPTADTSTYSAHADAVGSLLYGTNAAGNGYVTDVYNESADTFIDDVLMPQDSVSTNGPIPGHFISGAQVINNSYVDAENSNADALARWDFMIQRDNVTFVAAAAIDTGALAGAYLDWSAYDSLAVRGDQDNFIPTGSPGKTHADIWYPGHASFATATVSGFAAGLYGHAQAANQSAAQNDVVVRSLLMSGADKVNYTRDTTNNLSIQWGAGEADYANSLAELAGGQESVQSLSGGSVTGVLASSLKGWSYGTVPADTTSLVMFHSSGAISGITASLNWDVTSTSTATTINTSTGTLFPNLSVEVRPLVGSGNSYTLGPSLGIATLVSNTTGDNVQYIYSTSSLPAGNYAFVIGGDPALSAAVGFSYNISSSSTATQWAQSTGGAWNSSSNWSNGTPNSAGAQANFLSTPTGLASPGSVNLNGNIRVGEITFNSTQSYTIAQGTGGILTIDDTGDAGGVYPSISVIAGSHYITAPVSLLNGLNVNVTGGSNLSITNTLTGTGGLNAGGQGTLTLNGADNYGDTNVTGGTLAINGTIQSNNVSVNSGAALIANGSLATATALTANGAVTLGAASGTTVVARTLGSVNIGSGGNMLVSPSSSSVNRTVLVAGSLTLGGASGNWTGKLDLANNDMIVRNGNLSTIVSQITEGFNSHSGYWNGPGGIVSSSAASNSSHLTTLGAILNNDGQGNAIYGTTAPYGSFDGQNTTAADVLVKYTYYGDADLNGVVDGRDYQRIDMGMAMHLSGWVNGDFNYDGVVDGSDFSLIDNAFNQQHATPAPLSIMATPAALNGAAVPEPGTALAIAGLFCAFLPRQRKRLFFSKPLPSVG